MLNPYWYTLIRYLKRIGTIENGLTIPYLYGAYRRLGIEINSIEYLLNEILNSPAPFLPVIERCDIIHKDVLQLEMAKEVKKNRKDQVQIFSENGDNILVISYNTKLGNTVKQVSNALSGLYQKQIDKENYSWNNDIEDWQKFTDFDKECIDRIK